MSDEAAAVSGSSAFNDALPYLAWTIALVGMIGSMFFSVVMELPPCDLCWYQRIALYPLVVIIAVGIGMGDGRWKWYALPLVIAGLALAGYHNLLYYGIIPEGITPCTEGVPCTARQIEWLGFITIPLMGLLSFVSLLVILLIYRPNIKNA
jgi:disulfide bond formation protein DsbB